MKVVPASIEELRELVEAEYGVSATAAYAVPVRHVVGDLLWEATVQVFGLEGNPDATEAFAQGKAREKEERRALDRLGHKAPSTSA